MKVIRDIMRWGIVLFLILGSNPLAHAKQKKRSGQLVESINEAVQRSDSDQERIKVRFDNEAEDRMETWADRDRELIEIRYTGTSSIEPVDIGDPDYSYEEVGIDQSGLNNLHSDYQDESIDIDFDKELRDISSVKD